MSYLCTIGIPCYNSYKNLISWRDKIKNNESLEFFFVDGASTDGSPELLREWSSDFKNVRYVSNDKGLYSSMNSILTGSTSDWIYILGVTDNFNEETFKDDFPSHCGAIVYSILLCDQGDKVIKTIVSDTFKNNLPHHQSIVMNRLTLERNGLEFDESMEYYADAKIIAFLKYNTVIEYRNKVIGIFALGGKSTNGRQNLKKMKELFKVYVPYGKYYLFIKSILRLIKYL